MDEGLLVGAVPTDEALKDITRLQWQWLANEMGRVQFFYVLKPIV